mgnify:CR=1 FL=1
MNNHSPVSHFRRGGIFLATAVAVGAMIVAFFVPPWRRRLIVVSASDQRRLEMLAGQSAIALDNARLFREVLDERNYSENVLRSLSDAVMTVDTHGNVVKLNDAARRLLRVKAYEVLTSQTPFRDAVTSVAPGLSIASSVTDLVGAEVELVNTIGREKILRERLAEQILPYDLVMMDCPPSMGLLTLNALVAADGVLFVATANSNVFALDQASGCVRWRFSANSSVRVVPLIR